MPETPNFDLGLVEKYKRVLYQCDSTQQRFNNVPSGYMFLNLPVDVLQAIVQNVAWNPPQEHPEKSYS